MTDIPELTQADIPSYDFGAFLNRVRVKVVKVENVSKGGIITSVAKDQRREQMAADVGVVQDFGPDACADYLDKRLTKGAVVLFAQYAGKVCPETDGEYRIINDTDIIAIGTKKEGA